MIARRNLWRSNPGRFPKHAQSRPDEDSVILAEGFTPIDKPWRGISVKCWCGKWDSPHHVHLWRR